MSEEEKLSFITASALFSHELEHLKTQAEVKKFLAEFPFRGNMDEAMGICICALFILGIGHATKMSLSMSKAKKNYSEVRLTSPN